MDRGVCDVGDFVPLRRQRRRQITGPNLVARITGAVESDRAIPHADVIWKISPIYHFALIPNSMLLFVLIGTDGLLYTLGGSYCQMACT